MLTFQFKMLFYKRTYLDNDYLAVCIEVVNILYRSFLI